LEMLTLKSDYELKLSKKDNQLIKKYLELKDKDIIINNLKHDVKISKLTKKAPFKP